MMERLVDLEDCKGLVVVDPVDLVVCFERRPNDRK